jgi:hypothetical protein
MPELAFEMAYQTALWFKARPSHQLFLYPADNRYVMPYINYVQVNQIAARDACYTTWSEKENKFQVNKSTSISRQDKDFWLYTSAELTHHVSTWKGIFKEHAVTLDSKFIAFNQKHEREGYLPCLTSSYYICDL